MENTGQDINLIKSYMKSKRYLYLDQKKNDFIRRSLSWKLTTPIRYMKRYKVIFNKKVNYCSDYKGWSSSFPMFNNRDLEIYNNFRRYNSTRFLVCVMLEEDNNDHIGELFLSISQQDCDKKTILIVSHFLSNYLKEEISILSRQYNIEVLYNEIKFNMYDYIYITYGHSILKRNCFLAHVLFGSGSTLISYADNEILTKEGILKPFFKPDFSPELLKSIDYFQSGIVVHDFKLFKDRILKVLSKTYNVGEAILDCCHEDNFNKIVHVPFILSNYNRDIEICKNEIKEIRKEYKKISIIIPTKDNVKVLRRCLESIHDKTIYGGERIQIIIMNNGGKKDEIEKIKRKLSERINIIILEYRYHFNYSIVNNLGFSYADGDVIVFLNDDTKLLDSMWINKIVHYLDNENVGVIGCKLLYGNQRVQHNGCVIGGEHFSQHVGLGLHKDDDGFGGLMGVSREVSSVTGACMALRRGVFEKIGGFDENLRISFNDIALCLKALSLGYRNIVISDPLFIHYESMTRGLDLESTKVNRHRDELEYIEEKFSRCDPYYNSNLSLSSLYQLSYPPRRRKEWRHSKYNSTHRVVVLCEDKSMLSGLILEIGKEFDLKVINISYDERKRDDYIKHLCQEIFLNDTDYLIISSFGFMDISYHIGNFCNVFFTKINDNERKGSFFNLLNQEFILEGNTFKRI